MLRSSSLRFAGVTARSESMAMGWTLREDLAARSAEAGVASGLLGMEPSLVLGLTDRLCSRPCWDRGRWVGSVTGEEPWEDCEDKRWAGVAGGGGAGFGDG